MFDSNIVMIILCYRYKENYTLLVANMFLLICSSVTFNFGCIIILITINSQMLKQKNLLPTYMLYLIIFINIFFYVYGYCIIQDYLYSTIYIVADQVQFRQDETLQLDFRPSSICKTKNCKLKVLLNSIRNKL